MGGAGARVVVVHDYLTQRGGAERVTLDLLRAFPGSRLVTSVHNPTGTFPDFGRFDVRTLPLNRYELFRRDPRRAFPWLAKSFSEHVITDADVVICSSSGWSHRVKSLAPKIVYCHNPARWLYQPDDYFAKAPQWLRKQFVARAKGLRASDALAATSATRYLANSTTVAGRIASVYGIEAQVVHPARGLSPVGPREPVPGVEPGYLLTIGRARGYKNTEAVACAVAKMPGERLVVVGGLEISQPGVTSLRGMSDAQMRWLFDNAAGLVAVAFEDFGLTVVEAQAFGLPTVALRAGGYVDTGFENRTTVFVESPRPEAVADGIRRLRALHWDREIIHRFGRRFAPEVFTEQMRAIVNRVVDEPDSIAGRSPTHGARATTESFTSISA